MIAIREDDLEGADVRALIATHLFHSASTTPPESIHALGIEALRAPGITFWTSWDDDTLLGCGALKELSRAWGEVKSMHTLERYRRRGIAAAMLRHIIEEARARGYECLSLETGAKEAFAPARALYASFGFVPCSPFAQYRDDPFSAWMELHLADAGRRRA